MGVAEEIETVTYEELDADAKANADWEIPQRNSVGRHQKSKHIHVDLRMEKSLFYTNGVFAKRK